MRTKVLWITIIVLLVYIGVVWAAEKKTDSQTSQTPQVVFDKKDFLKDLKRFLVVIDGLKPELEKYGLTEEKLKTDVELRLRQSGIEIISKVSDLKDSDSEELATLVLSIDSLMLEETQQIGYTIQIKLRELVLLQRKPLLFFAHTWQHGYIGITNVMEISDIREQAKDLVDIFLNDYLAANPRTKPVQMNEEKQMKKK